MSSNLTPEAKAAYSAYLDAKTLDDRIEKLQKFISEMPKHKATEKIVALNKTRLSKLKNERDALLLRQKKLASGVDDPFALRREPHTQQVMMISTAIHDGMGVGKSTLLYNLTHLSHCRPGIFTPEPQVGIYEWSGNKFQFIEEPAIQDSQNLSKIMGNIRNTDILLFIVDLSQNPRLQTLTIINTLAEHDIYINRDPPPIKIEKTGSGGVQLFFLGKEAKNAEVLEDFLQNMVKEAGMTNATVKILGKVNIDDIRIAFNRSSRFKPAVIIATKGDLPDTEQVFRNFVTEFGPQSTYHFDILPVAIVPDSEYGVRKGLDSLGEILIKKLKLIRIFTKSKKGIADKPMLIPAEATVEDVAKIIHKELYNTFKFAYVYRKVHHEEVPERIRAGLQFELKEFDILEIFSTI